MASRLLVLFLKMEDTTSPISCRRQLTASREERDAAARFSIRPVHSLREQGDRLPNQGKMKSPPDRAFTPITGSTSGHRYKFALLFLGLFMAWDSVVLPVRAATASVSIAASDAAAAESGVSPANTGSFTVSRPVNSKNDGNATIDFSISGTADNGIDYLLRLPTGALIPTGATSGTVIIPDGDTSAVITVEPVDDSIPEDVESVTLRLTGVNLGYLIAPSPNDAATVTISDNDTTVSISATVADAAESGLVPGILTVSRTDSMGLPIALSFPVTVNYTISGTASNGTDYNSIGTTVTIPADSATATVTITPIDDALNETSETVTLRLAGSRLSREYLSSSPSASLNARGLAATACKEGPSSLAAWVKRSSGMASGARKAHSRKRSATAALACSTLAKESDHPVSYSTHCMSTSSR